MFSVGNLQLSVGKLKLPAPPTFLTHDSAAGSYWWHMTGNKKQQRRKLNALR